MKIKDAFYFSIFKRKTKLVSWPMKKKPERVIFFQNKKTATSHASFSRSTLVPLSSFSIVSPSFSEFCLTHAVSFFGFFPPSLADCVFSLFFWYFCAAPSDENDAGGIPISQSVGFKKGRKRERNKREKEKENGLDEKRRKTKQTKNNVAIGTRATQSGCCKMRRNERRCSIKRNKKEQPLSLFSLSLSILLFLSVSRSFFLYGRFGHDDRLLTQQIPAASSFDC